MIEEKSTKKTKSRATVLTRTSGKLPVTTTKHNTTRKRVWLLPAFYGVVLLAAVIIFGVVTYNVFNATPSASKSLTEY